MDLNVDYLAADNWDEAMFERIQWLCQNQPVYWAEKSRIWVVTSFETVSQVSKDQLTFTSGQGVRPGTPAKLGLLDEEEPRHTALRGMINKGFTPRMVRRLEGVFREITTEALDKIAEKSECDFVEDIAVPLPLLLIAEMIGIHRQDRERFHHWSDTMIAADGNSDNPQIMAAATQAFLEYSEYLGGIIDDRRENPRDDLVSILVGAKDQGLLTNFGREALPGESDAHLELANDELIMLLTVLMVAGNETTRNGISGGMQLLIENPGERDKLIRDPGLLPSAVEEMVRLVSPVQTFGRTVTRDTELAGEHLEAGQKVLIVYPSANRDPSMYDDPHTFRVERNPHHLGFGMGTHFCMGANLARMEMRVAFEELLRRFPDMEYAGSGPIIKPAALVRSCVEMRVRYTPE